MNDDHDMNDQHDETAETAETAPDDAAAIGAAGEPAYLAAGGAGSDYAPRQGSSDSTLSVS